MRKIIQNEIKCKECGDVIFSRHRHDFKGCSCKSVAVDGGMDYTKRVFVGMLSDGTLPFEERSMAMEEEHLNSIVDAVKWGRETRRNDLGIALAVVRSLRENGYLDLEKFKV